MKNSKKTKKEDFSEKKALKISLSH